MDATQDGLHADEIFTKFIGGVNSRTEVLFKEADQEGYDTIVVGRRGLSGGREFFTGRVSNKAIQLARKKAVWVAS